MVQSIFVTVLILLSKLASLKANFKTSNRLSIGDRVQVQVQSVELLIQIKIFCLISDPVTVCYSSHLILRCVSLRWRELQRCTDISIKYIWGFSIMGFFLWGVLAVQSQDFWVLGLFNHTFCLHFDLVQCNRHVHACRHLPF